MKRLISIFLLLCVICAGCGTTPVLESLPPTESAFLSEGKAAITLPSSVPENSTFEIHFIDVGQADATLVLCDGYSMLIDGGNREDSSLIVAYLKKCHVDYLDYMICTHPHEDHVGGLSGALNACSVGCVIAPTNTYDSDEFQHFLHYVEEQGLEITLPEVGTYYALGNSSFQILAPQLQEEVSENNSSIVLRIVYGNTSFLLTGDAERESEVSILNSGYDLESTVLKVGHHGSDTSTSYVFLREVMPQYAIISVGKDNPYGHPDEEVLSRLRDAEATVYRTDRNGDIILQSDGETIQIKTEKQESSQQPSQTVPGEVSYIGNINSKKFHNPDCSSLPAQENQVFFSTRTEAVEEGYTPCGRCQP